MVTILVALALFAPSQSQGLEKPISYECQPTRAEIVVKDLSKASGVQLVTSTDLADAVLVIRVKGVPMDALLAKIADVTAAEWKQDKGFLKLLRTTQREKELDRQDFEKQRVLFEKAIVSTRAKAEAGSKFGPEDAKNLLTSIQKYNGALSQQMEGSARVTRMMNLTKEVPIAKLATRLAACFDAATLARLPFGQTVFSNDPTAMEASLPKGANRVILEVLRQQNVWRKAVEAMPEGGVPRNPRPFEIDASKLRIDLPDDPLVFVTASKYSLDAPTVYFSATAVDGKGQTIPTYTEVVTYESPREPAPTAPLGEVRSVKLPPATALFYSPGVEAANAPPAELREMLRSPEIFDPLRFTSAGMLVSYAEAKDLNLVGLCSDALLNSAHSQAEMTPRAFRNLMTASAIPFGSEWREETGWLLIQPRLRSLESFRRIDRKSSGVLLKKIDGPWIQKLDEVADFAAKLPPNNLDVAMISAMANRLRPQAAFALPSAMHDTQPSFENYDRWKLLRFYGDLSPAQRQAVWNGGLSLEGLSPEQESRLSWLIYSTTGYMELKFDPQPAAALYKMPTRALPNGIPPGAVLRGTAKVTPVLYATIGASPSVHIAFGRDLTYAWEQPKEVLANLDLYTQMELFGCTLTVDLAPGIRVWDNHFVATAPSGLEFLPLDRLAQGTRDLFKDELGRLRAIRGGG